MATENATTQTLAGQVERRRGKERLHHDHADADQRAVDQVVLLEPFLFLRWVLSHGHHLQQGRRVRAEP
jgi:hypothetical protein